MPIFELDAGRPVLVQPMQPAQAAFDSDASAVVAEHLGSLLGEQLLPIAIRRNDDAPHLLALDAAGQPVVVEVVQTLDEHSLIRALQFAGAASRLSSVDLARRYHDGAEKFGADLVAFRESLPVTAVRATPLRVGARLLLVCSSVDAAVVDAVEFLRAPGRQVDVLQIGIIHGKDGRRYLDVSPLVGAIPVDRTIESSSLRLVRSDDAFAAAMAYDADRAAVERRKSARRRPGPDHEWPASPLDPAEAGPKVSAARAAVGSTPSGELEAAAARPSTDPSGVRAQLPKVVFSPEVAAALQMAADLDAAAAREDALAADEARVVAPAPADTGIATELPDPSSASIATEPPDPTLAAIATELDDATQLVWFRERRGERIVATLRRDGRIELPDGSAFSNPSQAASAAVGTARPIDGWSVWRFGDDGPSLAEAREA